MIVKRTVLELLARTFLYSLMIVLIDFVIIFFFQVGLATIKEVLPFVLLFEGGLCLTVGGAAAFYSPVSAKISEVLFHSKPWNARRQKEVEKQARTWIVTGIFLVFAALLLSAV